MKFRLPGLVGRFFGTEGVVELLRRLELKIASLGFGALLERATKLQVSKFTKVNGERAIAPLEHTTSVVPRP